MSKKYKITIRDADNMKIEIEDNELIIYSDDLTIENTDKDINPWYINYKSKGGE